MERVEALFKALFDIIVFSIVYLVLSIKMSVTPAMISAVILAHTINWLFNGQLYVLGRYLGFTHTKPSRFIAYPDTIKRRLIKRKSIKAVAFFGGLSRGSFSKTSDLDTRIISQAGLINSFIACFWVFLERSLALLYKYPLDIYVISKPDSFRKLDRNEYPIVLFDHTDELEKYYSHTQDFQKVKADFLNRYAS